MKYLLIFVVVIIISVVGYLVYQNLPLFQVTVEKTTKPEDVVIPNWGTYKNNDYGFEVAYPAELTVDESYASSRYYPARVEFKSNLVRLGSSFGLTIYDAKYTKGKIKTIDDIPHLTKEDVDRKVTGSRDITTPDGIIIRIIRGVQYSFERNRLNTTRSSETVSILFMNGLNAYSIEWSCWPLQACFNDQILDKLVSSIKFSK